MGKEANISKARYLYGNPVCICGRYKREGVGALPGEVSEQAGNGKDGEVSRGHSSPKGMKDRTWSQDLWD